ncbi:MAG: 3-dehydroquinate synthase [Planctomycetota bacterium]
MQSIQVPLGQRSYRIYIGTPGAQDLAVAIRENCPDASKLILIVDQNILPMAMRVREAMAVSTSDAVIIEVPSGEGSKSVRILEKLWQQMAYLKADRKAVVVALGGGVVGDLAGFLAASWNRGVRLVQIPTTLLAMVDSSVGGKTGINLPEAKNVIGAFWQPSMVWIDLMSLDSLPEREYRSGLAEVVKYGVIMDAEFFGWLEANVVSILSRKTHALEYLVKRCCELKAQVVAADEHETTGLRAILNYGHTFGHAIETLATYGTYLHGEAVSIGMTMAGRLAANLERWTKEDLQRQTHLLAALGLPIELTASNRPISPDSMLEAMMLDKKTLHGGLRLILPSKIGHVETVKGVPHEAIVKAILG